MSQNIDTFAHSTSPAHALSRRSLIGLAVASLVTGALVLLLVARLVGASGAVGDSATTPLVGHAAADFTISVWNGKPGETLSLSSLKGKPVVVNFWASWCDNCQTEQYVLSQAWAKYQSQGVVFVGVAFQDKQSDGAAFLADRKVAYPAGAPSTARTPIDYAVTGVPETVFIGRDGRVVSKIPGAVDDVTLDQNIQAILK
jgi:cytochrome c biogenesis protein CcmG, thiol:disulfide interchange protein DsbE